MAVCLGDDSPPSNGPICPVCFRDYSDNEANLIPRILQCGHTYCTECLDRLLNTEQDADDFEQVVLQIRYGGREWTTVRRQPLLSRTFATNELKCPTCNTMNFITNRDVHTLTKNFALLGCRPSSQNQTQRQNSSKHFCTEHSHEKRVYCKDCRELVCAYCQLYGAHKSHDCAIASEAAQPSVEALKAAVDSVSSHLKELSVGEKAVNKAERRLKKNRHQCERQVKGYFDQLIRSLEAKRNSLLVKIGSWTDEQMYILNAQMQSLASAVGDSENLQKTCDSLIKGDPLDALSQQDEVIKEVTQLQKHVRELALQPLINPWIKCDVNDVPSDVLSDLLKNCTLTYDTDVQSGDEPIGSDLDRDFDSLSGDDILSSSERDEDDSHHNRLTQEGAGASASPNTKGMKKYYQETHSQMLQHWSPFSSEGASMMPTLDSPEYPSWNIKPPQATNQTASPQPTASMQGAFPSPPNNSFLSSGDMPTSQASDPNSMFLNPISTKAKYTNLLHRHPRRLRTLSDLDSGSNTDDEVTTIPPRLSMPLDRPFIPGRDLSSSDSHHSDEENDSSLMNVLGSPFVRSPAGRSRFLRHVFNRSVSMGECSASPDEDDDEGNEARITAGEIFSLPPMDSVPRNSSCQSPDQEDDFAYTHHLTMLHGDSAQSNEIVIPVRQHYSWTSMPSAGSRTVRTSSSSTGGSRAHTLGVDMSQVGSGSVEVLVGGGGDRDSEDSTHDAD